MKAEIVLMFVYMLVGVGLMAYYQGQQAVICDQLSESIVREDPQGYGYVLDCRGTTVYLAH